MDNKSSHAADISTRRVCAAHDDAPLSARNDDRTARLLSHAATNGLQMQAAYLMHSH